MSDNNPNSNQIQLEQNNYPNQNQSQVQNQNQSQNQNQNQNEQQPPNTNNIINENNEGPKNEKTEEQKKQDQIRQEYEMSIEYMNSIRQEIEMTTPLISEELPINILLEDYKSNIEYSSSIKEISNKYKHIRKVRRDGNCFYRSFIYRIFEYICMKNNRSLYDHMEKKINESKDLITRNGYDWAFIEEFYNFFRIEFNHCFYSIESKGISVRDYLDNLFSDKEKGNYLIYFVRFCIASFLKENAFLYEVYVDVPFENWISSEVEAIDHEADQIQIMACVNYFDIGVKIEYLNPNKNEVVKFPEDKPDDQVFITVLFTPGHYDLLYA